MPHDFDGPQAVEHFYTSLVSLKQFDEAEVRGVVRTLISPSRRDLCITMNYSRAIANVESLLALKNVRDVQAIAMIVRSLFEISVDVRLIDRVTDAVEKMLALPDVEKLRTAKKIVAFKLSQPMIGTDVRLYEEFIQLREKQIDKMRADLWPGVKRLEHWSNMKLSDRTKLLGAPFDELYETQYPQLSWYVHSGLTGVINLEVESLRLMAGTALTLAMRMYTELLILVIDEFGLTKADDQIKRKLHFAKMLPFADDEEQAAIFRTEMFG